MKRFIISLFLSIGLCTFAFCATDMEVMRENLRKEIMLGDLNYDRSDPAVQAYIASIVKDAKTYYTNLEKSPKTYLWSDYNKLINDNTNTCKHIEYSLMRLHTMALAWAYPTSELYHNDDYLTAIKNSLDFLYSYALNEKTSLIGNWWEWRIGSPQEYAAIVSILYEELSAEQISHYDKSFNTFVRTFAKSGNMTYANQADVCRNLLYMGILTGKTQDVTNALTLAKKAFVDETSLETRKQAQAQFEKMIKEQGDYHQYNPVTKKEGLYEDGTFIQHTAIPYIGSYGTSMIQFSAEMALCLKGVTSITIPSYFNQILPTWMEKAYIPAIYKGEMMRMFMGRNTNANHSSHEAARAVGLHMYLSGNLLNDSDLKQRITNVCKTWYTDNAYYSTPYEGMNIIIDKPHIDQMIKDAQESASADVFNLVLAAGDRVIHETAKFRFGLSMSSNRIGKFEGFSNNNMSGWYQGDGMTYIYTPNHREHWLKYFTYCNNYRLPGTTVDRIARTADGANIALFDNPVNAQSWVGGISLLGRYGAAGMSHVGAKSDLVAKKSWFMFDDEVHCLGAGITMSENREVETIIESRYINAGYSVDGVDGGTKKCWEYTYTNPSYAYINEVGGYYFPQPMTMTSYIEQNKLYSFYINHGKAPKDASYNYILLPQMSKEDVAAYALNPTLVTLQNDTTIQSVYHTTLGIVGLNYWHEGKQASVYSDGAASVMYQQKDGKLYFAAAEPTWKRTSQTFILDGEFALDTEAPKGKTQVSVKDGKTTITIDCTDRMGQGEQLVFTIIKPMPTPTRPTDIEIIKATAPNVYKVIDNGQIFIYRNGTKYSIL